jgi:hypothetical protein
MANKQNVLQQCRTEAGRGVKNFEILEDSISVSKEV